MFGAEPEPEPEPAPAPEAQPEPAPLRLEPLHEPEPEPEQPGKINADMLERAYGDDKAPDAGTIEMYASAMKCSSQQVSDWFAWRGMRENVVAANTPTPRRRLSPSPTPGGGAQAANPPPSKSSLAGAVKEMTKPMLQRARSASSAAMKALGSRSPSHEQSAQRSRQVTEGWRSYLPAGLDSNWLAHSSFTRGSRAEDGTKDNELTARVFACTDWEGLATSQGHCAELGVLRGVRLLPVVTVEEGEVISAGQTCRVYTGRFRPYAEQQARWNGNPSGRGGGSLRDTVIWPSHAPGDPGRAAAAAAPASQIPEGLPPDEDGMPVALKKLYLQQCSEDDLSELSDEDRGWVDDACRQFDSEASLLSSIDHPHVLQLHGVSLGPPALLCLVLDLAERSLWELLHESAPVAATEGEGAGGDGGGAGGAGGAGGGGAAGAGGAEPAPRPEALRVQDQLRLGREASTAVAFLHAQQPPIAHCDLKSGNFLIGRDGLLKLADFVSHTHTLCLAPLVLCRGH